MPKILTATILAAMMLSAAPATAGCPRPTPQGPKKPDDPICEQPFSGAETTLDSIMATGPVAR